MAGLLGGMSATVPMEGTLHSPVGSWAAAKAVVRTNVRGRSPIANADVRFARALTALQKPFWWCEWGEGGRHLLLDSVEPQDELKMCLLCKPKYGI